MVHVILFLCFVGTGMTCDFFGFIDMYLISVRLEMYVLVVREALAFLCDGLIHHVS